jgi:ElaB/YqjD/DUF883 family membrane-anchored ribosome-binding protein
MTSIPAPVSSTNDRNLPAAEPPTAKELLHDLKTLLLEAERLAATTLVDRSAEAAEALRERIGAERMRFAHLYSAARDKTTAGARCTDAAIRANPYRALAIALAVGIVGGMLLRRSRRRPA